MPFAYCSTRSAVHTNAYCCKALACWVRPAGQTSRFPGGGNGIDSRFRGAEGADKLEEIIADLTSQMLLAAEELKFELAARLRDEVSEMKRELRSMDAAGHI